MPNEGLLARIGRALGFGSGAARPALQLPPPRPDIRMTTGDGKPIEVHSDYLQPGLSLDSLQNAMAGLNTSRDKRAYSQYVLPVIIDRQTLEAAYTSSWVVGKIVDLVAEDMTREWVNLQWDGYDTNKSNVYLIEAEEARLGVRQKWNEGNKWARLYGGGAALLDVAGQIDLSVPLDPTTVKKGQLRSIHVYDRWWCAATGELDYNRNLPNGQGNPNFGMPAYYMVGAPGEPSARVHWTRLVRFEGRRLPRNLFWQRGFWHDSVIQHVIDCVQDYDAMTGGIASMVWEANVDILMIDKLADRLGTNAGAQQIQQFIGLMMQQKSFNRSLLLDKEKHDYKQKKTELSGVRDVLVEFESIVSAAAGIPITKLFGSSAKGLSNGGEENTRNYYDEVRAHQNADLRPGLDYFYQVFMRSTLGEMPKNFRFDFKPLWQTTKLEEAQIAFQQAQADQIYMTNKVVTPALVARELKDRAYYRTMEPGDVDDAEQRYQDAQANAAKLSAAPPPPAPGGPAPGAPAPGSPIPPPKKKAKPGEPPPAADESIVDIIRKESNGWNVYSENGSKHLGGPYKTKAEAVARLVEIEGHKEEDAA